ncbi:MAG: sugar-transfer associated ATP-grasp domain-containing protein, partial [Bacteroidota bacterium]
PTGWKAVARWKAIAVKPAKGRGGGGIWILKQDEEGHWTKGGKRMREMEIFQHMANIIMGLYSFGSSDRVLIEECIVPHPFFHEIYPAGVPDFRVILVKDRPVMSMLRVPTDRSDGKANLHQGGLGIGVDAATGHLTEGYDGERYHDHHPDSGARIRGLKIPHWEAVLSVSIATSRAFPLDYLGIDIVIDAEKGPLILEINVRPGLGIQLVNRTGIKAAINQLARMDRAVQQLP